MRRAHGRLALALLLAVALDRPRRAAPAAGAAVTADDLAAMAWLRDHTGPLDVVCNDSRPGGLWVPALAARGIAAPDLPAPYAEEFQRRARERPCAYVYGSATDAPAGTVVFRSGAVVVARPVPGL